MAKAKKPVPKTPGPKPRRKKPIAFLPFLSMYRDQKRLVFENDDELDRAIDLLWTDELYNLPHGTPDGKSLIIPEEAVKYFRKAGIKFEARDMRSIDDMSPEEIAAMRRGK